MPNPINKIVFKPEEHQFLRDNYITMTNQQLADALGLKLTRLRNELRELGLKRMRLEYWTTEQVEYLKSNYRRIGNKELAKIFNERFPKDKGWTRSHITKKLKQLGLKRNKLDVFLIKERNRKNGSYGKMNEKNQPDPPKVYIVIDKRTRIEVGPNTDVETIREKYANRTVIV